MSFADLVDDALFHPHWGYYATGGVRFGTGGHYDTYPLALSPLFGRMVAEVAWRSWRRAGRPARFEICELGAGNGQLCLDVLLWVQERARHERSWRQFADSARYRIFERSPALIERQRQQLGPLMESVRWSRANLAQRRPRGVPLAPAGLIVANEVLDCLPHHQVVAGADGRAGALFVTPELAGTPIGRTRLAAVMSDGHGRQRVRFREHVERLERVPHLARFLRRYRSDLLDGAPRGAFPYFACPQMEGLFVNTAQLYPRAEALWIDYGDRDALHRSTASRRVFAGPPRSNYSVYDDPGRHDITFMVDFSAAISAARRAGWQVRYYGPQGELARRSGVVLDRAATELILRHRVLRWMLAFAGVGPERGWQRGAVSWSRGAPPGHVPVRQYVEQAVREFRSARSPFQLLITRTG